MRELESSIPLNCKLVVRYPFDDLLQLVGERRLIDGLERGAILFAKKTADHAKRGR